jgi:hypothetical protein
MDELTKTYTLAHSPDGWRVNFSTGIAPGFGVEPHYNLREVIRRVETLYPEYRPRLTTEQLAEHAFEADLAWAIKRDLARQAGIDVRASRLDGEAPEIEKIVQRTAELRERLIGLAGNLREHTMPGHPDELALLQHRLSDLRAHVEVARREVALAKRRPAGGDGAFQRAKVMQAQGPDR